ncbi:MAG: NAD(P)-dependent oxidoreductase [Thermoleophilia bacterium]
MNEPRLPSVCVVGLGLMGRPMARTLSAAGVPVTGWNRSALVPDLIDGIDAVPSLEEASMADVLLLILSDSTATDAVLEQVEPFLDPGQVVLDMGSSDPARTAEHAPRLARRGIGWVDAPVSGGPEGARSGSLAIMAGGAEADFELVRPLLEVLGSVTLVGGPGAGHTTKVVNQLICGLAIQAVAEGLTLAERAGLDPRRVQEALRGGFADSKVLQLHGTRMVERAYVPGGKASTHLKDMRLAAALAAAVGADLPSARLVEDRYARLVEQGDGDLDHSALHKLLWD